MAGEVKEMQVKRSTASRRRFLAALGIALAAGCGRSAAKPKESDWARRRVEGLSLEAPYEFTGNENPLPGYVNIASYKPALAKAALDIRIDVLQAPVGMPTPTLEEFAKAVFSLETLSGGAFKSDDARPVKVGEYEGWRSRAVNQKGVVVEGVVIRKGDFFWLVEVYFDDPNLSSDAQRVLDSVQVE